jgi:hypothetical protein
MEKYILQIPQLEKFCKLQFCRRCLFANCGAWQFANWIKLPQMLDFQDEIPIQGIGIILAIGQAGQFNL